MTDFLTSAHPWLKSLHIIAVISWMAGLLYLPRLFVYHADAELAVAQTLAVMERRLLQAIMTPAMLAVWTLGFLLAVTPGAVDWSAGWMYAKLILVALLSVYHMLCARWRKELLAPGQGRSQRFYRIANEVPTVLMIAIVVLVVAQPF